MLGLRAVATFRVSKERIIRLDNVKIGHYINTSDRNLKLCLPVKNKHQDFNSVLFLQVLTCPCSLSLSPFLTTVVRDNCDPIWPKFTIAFFKGLRNPRIWIERISGKAPREAAVSYMHS